MPEQDGMHWVGTWTTTLALVEGVPLSNQTLRMIAHFSIGGPRLRVCLSNAYGTAKPGVGTGNVALRGRDAAIAEGSGRKLTFNESPSTSVERAAKNRMPR